MYLTLKNVICFFGTIYFLPLISGHPEPQVADKAVQIFDAARQTVTDVVGVAQGVVNTAIDAAKNTIINDITTVQDAARLGVETGRNVILFGEDTILRMLNAGNDTSMK